MNFVSSILLGGPRHGYKFQQKKAEQTVVVAIMLPARFPQDNPVGHVYYHRIWLTKCGRIAVYAPDDMTSYEVMDKIFELLINEK